MSENTLRLISSSLLLLSLALAPLKADAPHYPELPPLWCYDDADKNTSSPARIRALGPIFETRLIEDPKLSYHAFRPLWSREVGPDGISCTDVIWPLGAWRDSWHVKYYWALLYFDSTDPNGDYRRYFVPSGSQVATPKASIGAYSPSTATTGTS